MSAIQELLARKRAEAAKAQEKAKVLIDENEAAAVLEKVQEASELATQAEAAAQFLEETERNKESVGERTLEHAREIVEAAQAPTEKPDNLLDLLKYYPTVDALKADTHMWNQLSLRERIDIGRHYLTAKQLAAEPQEIVKEDKPEKPKSELEQLMEEYPTLTKLRESAKWKELNIAAKAHVAKAYADQAQRDAIYAARTMREAEKVVELEEQSKANLEVKVDSQKHEAFALDITLNERQQMGVDYALAGKCFVLTGAAGTGKTTACREIARAFLKRGDLGLHTFKEEGGAKITSHGIAFCSYTRRATSNIRRALHKDETLEKELSVNVVTIHRLLEFEPEFFQTPEGKNSMRFIPRRNAQKMLDIKVLVIEEASMLGLDLWEKLYAAMRPGTIVVFVGDINQLPPVFGKSIMNYALGQLPVVELTEVYRQAFDSGVIVNAHRILKGLPPEENKDTQIVTGKSPTAVGQERMARALGATFFNLWQSKDYDPEQDIILSPWNKQPCGTDNLNNWIAQFLGEQRKAMVYEVLAGRRKLYLAVGDRVMYEKRDGVIKAIRHNAQYLGKSAQPASTDLTRFGLRKLSSGDSESEDFELQATGYENINIDDVPDEEKKLQASHTVTLALDGGEEAVLSAVGEFAEQTFSLGYCLTVHKAQGCEWRRVYIVLHKDHTLGGFLSRELVYTAVTRAREKVILIAKPETLKKAVATQNIKGNTLEEKIQSINSGASNIGTYPVVKEKRAA